MNNSDKPAFPIEKIWRKDTEGLNKRELFAIMALHGLLSSCNGPSNNPDFIRSLSEVAVKQADALLEALNPPQTFEDDDYY